MNILVTGSRGQLGSEVKRLLSDLPLTADICCFYPTSAELNICNGEAVSEYVINKEIDFIINCAAYIDVAQAEIDSTQAFAINSTGAENLAKAIKQRNSWLIHISTDYVYSGEHIGRPFTEEDEPKPFTKYGESKLKGEQLIAASRCNSIILRVSWLYGCGENGRIAGAYRQLASNTHVEVPSNQVGSITSATDIAKAMIEIITKKKYENHCGVYNCSNKGESSIYDYYKLTKDYYHLSTPIKGIEKESSPYTPLDSSKFENTFGIKIRSWQEAYLEAMTSYQPKCKDRIKYSTKKLVKLLFRR